MASFIIRGDYCHARLVRCKNWQLNQWSFNVTGEIKMASNMFKFVGAMVVYGFAAYGFTAWLKEIHEEPNSPHRCD